MGQVKTRSGRGSCAGKKGKGRTGRGGGTPSGVAKPPPPPPPGAGEGAKEKAAGEGAKGTAAREGAKKSGEKGKKASPLHKPGRWDERPRDRGELVKWVSDHVGIGVVGAGLEYLCWTFFDGQSETAGESETGKQRVSETGKEHRPAEEPLTGGTEDGAKESPHLSESRGEESPPPTPSLREGASDSVVWACRGGGKTYLAALATALDLIHKPGIQIKLLAGSIEQAGRMHEHLRSIFSSGRLCEAVKGRVTARKVELLNGSRASLMAASQASVRGARVHKLRCDEVELFTDEIWRAAQLVTKARKEGGREIPGSIECFSTMHHVGRLMSNLVRECEEGKRRLFRWGVVEVLGECDGRECRGPGGNGQSAKLPKGQMVEGGDGADGAVVQLPVLDESRPGDCVLWPECRGEAKREGRVAGHLSIADAIAQKRRVGVETWDSEMLCLRPRMSDVVLREFLAARHVVGEVETSKLANGQTGKSDGDSGSDLLVCQFAHLPVSEPRRLVCGMDFGWRSPTVVLWGEVDAAGILTIVDERVVSAEVMDRHVAAITGSARGRPAWVGIDPSGARMNEHTGVSNADVLRAAGLEVKYRHWPVAPGLAKVRARLSPADGSPPRLLVHARCVRLIESLESYRYDPQRPLSVDPLKDGSDHAVDALRYLVVALDEGEGTKAGAYW